MFIGVKVKGSDLHARPEPNLFTCLILDRVSVSQAQEIPEETVEIS